MKKDLKSLKKSKKGGVLPNGVPADVAENFAKQSKRYEGKSENELMGEIMKRKGEIDVKELERFEKTAGAMLSAEQKKKLRAIMNKLS